MCSIFLTNRPGINLDLINRFLRPRGPDHTELVQREGLIFIHNLLSINGAFQVQPFQQDHLTALYNGEIYNHQTFGTFTSDGQCIIPAYLELGSLFPQALDGEYAIAVVDHAARCVTISTDVFATKPLYVAFEGPYFGVASYESALVGAGFATPVKVPANRICRIDLDAPALVEIGSVYEFSLVQYRRDFDAWIDAFERAVRKRVEGNREKVFIGLSSGYDSGAICCALSRLGVPFHAYSVTGKENDEILAQRAARMSADAAHHIITPDADTRGRAREYIDQNVEVTYYTIYSAQGDYNEFGLKLHDDSGATGLSMVCEAARRDNCKIYLSGQGADEIISDYGFGGQRLYRHSNFGGLFPEDLSTIFPWPSFFSSSQESYLRKEEYVAGSYGIEARYPFLDKRVVQEFLALDHRLKNQCYKSVLRTYLDRHGYPTAFDTKIGF